MKLDGTCEDKEKMIDRLHDWKPDAEPDIDSNIWPGLCHILQADAGEIHLS